MGGASSTQGAIPRASYPTAGGTETPPAFFCLCHWVLGPSATPLCPLWGISVGSAPPPATGPHQLRLVRSAGLRLSVGTPLMTSLYGEDLFLLLLPSF